ncbi:enoyl-CoA hydratase family protein [Actibacterium sp. MT2.3-13A]|uniref:oxepin-CoA hydrolase, alternative type n=1 Tax=Actibacterium sp. MT2.3-13A TaxID=2828332 RepID=UPI001BAB42E5|nr:enoyl-CoA hydratase family protein [Actibacterium sp. MT2.3-13A]
MSPPLARIEDLGDCLVVVNDNIARRNALTPDLYDALGTALARAGEEARIASVILWGAGGFICSGGDLTQLARRRELPRAARLERIEALHDLVRAIAACPKPVIAAVEGGAAGAGASLAFACDLIVAAETAQISAAYVRAGLVPDGGLTASLSALLPRALVSEMLLLGAPVPARRLHDLGAINALTPEGGAREAAMTLAGRIAAGPSGAQGAIKGLLATARSQGLAAQLDRERDAMADAVAGDEAGEGIGAFLEKRRPDFARLRCAR